jgi:hypothetical protein
VEDTAMQHLTERKLSDNRIVTGWQLRHGRVLAKVLDAHAACNGGLTVTKLSNRQSEKLFGVSRKLISIVNQAGPEAVEALEKGDISLSDLRAAAEQKSKSQRVARYVNRAGLLPVVAALQQIARTENPADLAALLLVAFGKDVMCDALDLVTAPPQLVAAE